MLYNGYAYPSTQTSDGLDMNSDKYHRLVKQSMDALIERVGYDKAWEYRWGLGSYLSAYSSWIKLERLLGELE